METTNTKCPTCGCDLEWGECRCCGGTGEVNDDDPINGPEWYRCTLCFGSGEQQYCPNCDEEDWR
jgi:hypothetical protein